MKTILILAAVSLNLYAAQVSPCDEARTLFLNVVKAGGSDMTLSKIADKMYPHFSMGSKGESCKYIRYSLRTLKKPYNGESVSPKDFASAVQNIYYKR